MPEKAMSRVSLERLLSVRVKRLDDVCDRGLISGSIERRDAKRLVRELQGIIFSLRGMTFAERIAAREEAAIAPVPTV